jgi:hypothetical protein
MHRAVREQEGEFESRYAESRDWMHPTWQARYDEALEESARRFADRHYQRLDVAQLIKHYLGLKKTLDRESILLYLYWEPTNADSIPTCVRHRDEIARFCDGLFDDQIEFAAGTYPDLWRVWASRGGWAADLAAALCARYLRSM